MVWSAAATLLGDSPPGSEFVSCPATPPVALLGERRAAPPGTRLREDFCLFRQNKGGDKIKRRYLMELHTIGIDLGKTVFHLVGLDSSGNVIVRKRCSRTQLLKYTANLRVQRIGMEACSRRIPAPALKQLGFALGQAGLHGEVGLGQEQSCSNRAWPAPWAVWQFASAWVFAGVKLAFWVVMAASRPAGASVPWRCPVWRLAVWRLRGSPVAWKSSRVSWLWRAVWPPASRLPATWPPATWPSASLPWRQVWSWA